MSLPVLSIVAFAIAIIVSCVSQINVGFLSIAFAFIIGVLFGGMKATDVAAGFRTNVALPGEWPGARFDLIWQFTLTTADPPTYDFAELEQHALGKNPQPAKPA